MSYSARRDTDAVVVDLTGQIIGPEHTAEWAEYQAWVALGNIPTPPPPLQFPEEAVKDECKRRIYAKASDNAQKNMLANFVSGTLSMAQEDAFKEGTAWIKSMQETCRALIVAQDWDYTLDSKWPECPPASEALAQRF